MQRASPIRTSENPSSTSEKKQARVEYAARYELEVNRQVAKAVIVGLGHFGAGQVVESLVYILELEHSVDMNSVACNIPGLRVGLNKMFGGAAYVIETKIVEALGKLLGVDSEGKTLELLVEMLRSRITEFVPTTEEDQKSVV